MKIDVYSIRLRAGYSYRRGDYIAAAFAEGLRRHGVAHEIRSEFDGARHGDLAVAYGWIHEAVFRAYGRYVYWDLGYWGRRPAGEAKDGFHRLALHDWDTITHMPRGMPTDRFEASKIELRPVARKPTDIALVAGMSGKSARTHGYPVGQWEAQAARVAGEAGWRPVHRPKEAKRMHELEPIEQALMKCGLLVTHHSNCAVDAIVAGVPVWAEKGAGRLISSTECPPPGAARLPDMATRRALMCDLAYAQWSVAEMRSGAAWEFIRGRL